MKERSNVTRDRVASATRNVSTPGAIRLHEFGKEAVAWARAADRGFLVDRHDLYRFLPKPRLAVFARVRGDSTGGSPPFYAVPYVRLRGIPALRYQGDTALSVDGEAKWGLTKRWWLVAFAGTGWTANETSLLREDESVSAGGVGFRYLIARSLGLQVGVDAAKGPEEWAFYLVVGASPELAGTTLRPARPKRPEVSPNCRS